MAIRLDYSYMLADNVDGGIPLESWKGAQTRFDGARTVFEERRRAGELGFLDLTTSHPSLEAIRRFADGAGQAFSDVVILGIGGSALGPIALRSALRSPEWNELDDDAREFFPRLHVLENVDPTTMVNLLDRLELGRTLFIAISKSGGTAETMAQYLIVRGRLEEALGTEAAKRHLVFITDPARGALRAIAASEGIVALDIPPNVGGRFSVLSPVGLLPAALIGIDVDALLAGARDMAGRCAGPVLAQNMAASYAMLQWLADTELGLHNHVFMPYSDPLRSVGAWFAQLWAESLGKKRKDGTSVGPTPIAALGVTDQHSQVQLYIEGTRDKTISFVAVAERGADIEIPKLHEGIRELAYLGGHTLGELIDIERRATAAALARHRRPSMTIGVERVDPWHVGGLMMLLEVATVYAGALYDINPLDQPGVELGKQFTYALLNRPDADAARREWEKMPQPTPHVVE